MAYTVVSFHAHPDDEVLLTGGTLARAAAEGHRVILVVATIGEAGLTAGAPDGPGLGSRRLDELRRSAAALGCARVEVLGYDDSGLDGSAGRADHAFARVDVELAAERLAVLLRAEGADLLTVYDPAGGYGHPDHVQVHRVGIRAAALAATPVVLEATVDRTLLLRALRVLRVTRISPPDWHPQRFRAAYSAQERITHRVDVAPYIGRKRTAMAAHATQTTADSGDRTLAALLRLPPWLFRRVLGTEWYVERGRHPGAPLDDIFASLRDHGGPPGRRAR